jgi:hypothetical protein
MHHRNELNASDDNDADESDTRFLLLPFTYMHEIAEQVLCMSRTKNHFGDCYEVFSIHGNVSFQAETAGGGTSVSFKVILFFDAGLFLL